MPKGPQGEQRTVVPMKVNALDVSQGSNTQLLPLFPYLHRGAIVPCAIAFESDGSGVKLGYFVHTNSVDEVAVTLASNGPMRTGDVWVGPRSHGVGGGSSEPFFRVGVVTQRQLETGEQPEEISFQCEQCNVELLANSIDVAQAEDTSRYVALPTTSMSNDGVARLNASDEARTCKACGHLNPPFPIAIWGWDRYVRNSRIVRRGWEEVRDLEVGKKD